ncbi:MAG: D-alanine--D-alanine ligase family protein [Anaerolineales bacterium]
MAKIRVLVLFGGRSGEHEISLISARSVLRVLDRERYEVLEVGITREGEWLGGMDALDAFEKGEWSRLEPVTIFPQPRRRGLFALRGDRWVKVSDVDVIFPVLHGTFGEDGTLQGLLEMAEVAYVGAGVVGSAVGMDKGVFKHVMRARGIPVVDWLVVTRREIETQLDDVVRRAEALSGYPIFTKPANLGSSVGVTRCKNRAELIQGLDEAARYDRRILIEHGIPQAREIEVSVLGNDEPQASIAGEIIPSREFYSYEAKYLDGTSGLLIPAPISDEQMARVQRLALEAYRAVDCAGMARVDFLMDRQSGAIYLNEINTIPGFTSISMYPKLWEASGLPYPQLVDRLIELALERQVERQRTERVYRR